MEMARETVVEMVAMPRREYEAMKNCVNCEHSEVCVVVHDRRNRRAGDYSACSKWKQVDGK